MYVNQLTLTSALGPGLDAMRQALQADQSGLSDTPWPDCDVPCYLGAVDLPAGAKPTIDRDFVIAQISAPSGLASQSEDEDEVDADEVPTTEMGSDGDAEE